jgi:NhaP-type Na+/H+ or K+/H+ antiporter
LPLSTASGEPFPGRELILILTFGVILGTLVLQGLTISPLIQLLNLDEDGSAEAEEEIAREEASTAALERIRELRDEWPTHLPLLDQLETRYRHRDEHKAILEERGRDGADAEFREHLQIRTAVIDAERAAVLDLRSRGVINDEVQRVVERDLDLEELRAEA